MQQLPKWTFSLHLITGVKVARIKAKARSKTFHMQTCKRSPKGSNDSQSRQCSLSARGDRRILIPPQSSCLKVSYCGNTCSNSVLLQASASPTYPMIPTVFLAYEHGLRISQLAFCIAPLPFCQILVSVIPAALKFTRKLLTLFFYTTHNS